MRNTFVLLICLLIYGCATNHSHNIQQKTTQIKAQPALEKTKTTTIKKKHSKSQDHEHNYRLQNSNVSNIKRCDLCQKFINGKYWAYENGRNVCIPCYKKYPKCASCGIPAKRGFRQGKKVYCVDCSKDVPVCDYCQRHIFGRYWQIGPDKACHHCKKHLPNCVRCNRLMREYLRVGKQKLCTTCAKETHYCARCRIPLLQYSYEFTDDERKFCENCVKYKTRCDICSKPLTPTYYEIGDKRNICQICIQTAVRDVKTAREILNKVLKFLKYKFNMDIHATNLHLVNAQKLKAIRNRYLPHSTDRRALGMFLRRKKNFDVYIESLLPYALCMSVLSHEYTHAWQARNFKKKTQLLWQEGLAEWIAYKTLLHYKYHRQAQAITKQKDIYGQGFRKVLELEKRYGEKQVLQKVIDIVNGE